MPTFRPNRPSAMRMCLAFGNYRAVPIDRVDCRRRRTGGRGTSVQEKLLLCTPAGFRLGRLGPWSLDSGQGTLDEPRGLPPCPAQGTLTHFPRAANLHICCGSCSVADRVAGLPAFGPSHREPGCIMPTYNPKEIEPRWQRFWLENKTF